MIIQTIDSIITIKDGLLPSNEKSTRFFLHKICVFVGERENFSPQNRRILDEKGNQNLFIATSNAFQRVFLYKNQPFVGEKLLINLIISLTMLQKRLHSYFAVGLQPLSLFINNYFLFYCIEIKVINL
jgi:hypothetical protein